MKKEFKQNGKVWHPEQGEGVVCVVIPNDRKPIKVIFKNGITQRFTGDEIAPMEKLYHSVGGQE